MGLREEALSTYEELEALFFQILKDKSMSWFGSLANPSTRDDSAPLLSVDRKPYRDLIIANSISVFDFRTYLLARQCAVLISMGRVVEVGRKAIMFLQTFGKRLREVEVSVQFAPDSFSPSLSDQNDIPPYFIESWMYSSALSTVDHCDTCSKSLEMSKAVLTSFNAVKGELIELARHQVRINFFYLPCSIN